MKALMDLHTHTLASGHAYSTLKENIEEAVQKGLKVLGTSDHSLKMPGTAHSLFFENYRAIADEILGVRILKGIEANILNFEGEIDVTPAIGARLEYAIASQHTLCMEPGSSEENTRAVIGAMKNPLVKIIGHPDDSRFPLELDQVARAAREHRVALELNNSSLQPRSARQNGKENARNLLLKAKEQGAYIILGSDAHIFYDVGNFDDAIKLLKEVNFPEELIINYDLDKLAQVLIK